MKKISVWVIAILAILGLSGCGTTYVNLDGTKAQETKIKKAKEKCDVDNKLYKLNEDLDMIDNVAFIIDAKGKVKEQYDQMKKDKEEKVYKEINECLAKEGLKAQQ